jgi:phosphoserine phosphatase
MLKKLSWLLLSVVCYQTPLNAVIYETTNVNDMIQHSDERTLVICDLDNTLIEPRQLIGSDQWFCYEIQRRVNAGESSKQACANTIPIYNTIQKITQVNLIDNQAPEVIKELKKYSARVISLTARNYELIAATQRQLKSVGIDFNSQEAPQMQLLENDGSIINHNNISYLNGQNKGVYLTKYLELNSLDFDKVVFIDDKRKNLEAVESVVENLGKTFIGLRYAALDEKVKSLDPNIASIQIEIFNSLFNNELTAVLAYEH